MLSRLRAALTVFTALLLLNSSAFAQEEPDPEPEPPPQPQPQPQPQPRPVANGASSDFSDALQTVTSKASPSSQPAAPATVEIFPDASKVWMTVREIDPIPIETARRGGKWLCSGGGCTAQTPNAGTSAAGDSMLQTIRLTSPTLPLPLTIWGRRDERGRKVLDFDPVLLTRRSYSHVCAYPPPDSDKKKKSDKDKVTLCNDKPAAMASPDSAELWLHMEWPRARDLTEFRYLAIVDACGNARVQPFQKTFVVPVYEVASGGCESADGRALRVFPTGGWVRVTAFNLDSPAVGAVVSATYRVTLPALESGLETNDARLLFPDPQKQDLVVDCSPAVAVLPPRFDAPQQSLPPLPSAPPVPDKPPADKPSDKPSDKASPTPPVDKSKSAPPPPPPAPPMPPPSPPPTPPANKPGPQPLAHEALVIAPEPLRQGMCHVRLGGQTKRRLTKPLALHVSLTRTDKTSNGVPIELVVDGKWIVTPNSADFPIPPLSTNFDGESRLRLAVFSDPLGTNGQVVLLSDAARVASFMRAREAADGDRGRRLVGSAVIHTVPICGARNFETLDTVGNCLRAYITIPVMFGLLQVTRAPWIEKPLVTKAFPLAAVGVALAFDSYDPVERRAFPVAGQIGGVFENLGDGRTGLMGYLGVAPTIPILGEGGNTTTIGLLGGVGLEYITNDAGPNEGVKPALFLSAVVQFGQKTPGIGGSGEVKASGSLGE
jgi:hypothetical protein